jgi:hypothetical protein
MDDGASKLSKNSDLGDVRRSIRFLHSRVFQMNKSDVCVLNCITQGFLVYNPHFHTQGHCTTPDAEILTRLRRRPVVPGEMRGVTRAAHFVAQISPRRFVAGGPVRQMGELSSVSH